MLSLCSALTPLDVWIVTHEQREEIGDLVTAIRRAFQGGRSQQGQAYYACGDDLGVDVRLLVSGDLKALLPEGSAAGDAAPACRLIVVLLHGQPPDAFFRAINTLAKLAIVPPSAATQRVALLPVVVAPVRDWPLSECFLAIQQIEIGALGERDIRPAHLALLALWQAWKLLGTNPSERLQLFISHAKRDGMPLAQSLRSQIQSLKWLENFYDADDILPGTQWRHELRRGVRESVLIVLRTDIYEQRWWCAQEMEWAEEFGCPAVIVDARLGTDLPREPLPVNGMPTVRVSDGNLVRILNTALREAVRDRLFRRSVDTIRVECRDTEILSVPRTSLTTLGITCARRMEPETKSTQETKKTAVLMPEPFRTVLHDVAMRLIRSYLGDDTFLGTPSDYLVQLALKKPSSNPGGVP